jgi:hypothetical protein
MFDKEIEFNTHEDYFNLKEDYPTPIKFNIPDWYRKLEHTVKNRTIKGCIPFLDSLTTGYLLKIPMDLHIVHNKKNPLNGKLDGFFNCGDEIRNQADILHVKSINLNTRPDTHAISQLKNSPLVEKNKNLPFYKILNPWRIKTPPGYSCLFIPPLNNSDDRFSIIPAIVDTDTFTTEINFPIVINGDKYTEIDTVLEKGTPYVQIIPFKRDSWQMKIGKKTTEELRKGKTFHGLKMLHVYKNKFWSKKSWK